MGNDAENAGHKEEAVKKQDTGYYFLLGGFLCAGLLFSGFGTSICLKSEAMKKWPGVSGKITSSFVDSYYEGSMTQRAGLESKTKYTPKVEYDYEFQGKAYKGKRIALHSQGSRSEDANRVADRYPVGNEVKVYVNPARPDEAYLQLGEGGGGWFLVWFGAFFIVLALLGSGELLINKLRSGKK